MHDISRAKDAVVKVVQGIGDDQLGLPTPCVDTSVGDLLDHLDGLSLAFAAAARKERLEGQATADSSRLGPDWRTRIPERLEDLRFAWSQPDAWTGMTRAGGIDMPGEVAGAVAIDEIIVHGWDLAVATGQDFAVPDDLVVAAIGFVEPIAAGAPQGTPGLFGPPLKPPEHGGPLAKLLALTGRDPDWAP
jgi:uncharacterized protein (TIGR03086 family)